MQDAFARRIYLLMQPGMYLAALGSGGLFFLLSAGAVANGWWWVLLPVMLFISPVCMAVLRLTYERPFGLTRNFVNPRVMSRGFVYGDFILLPIALMFGAKPWSELHGTQQNPIGFLIVSMCIGLLLAMAFAFFDGKRYVKAGVPSARFSPTKVWHDWAVVPGVTALFFWVVTTQTKPITNPLDMVICVISLLGFLAALMYDFDHPVDPRLQHPEWDTAEFQALHQRSKTTAPARFHACSG